MFNTKLLFGFSFGRFFLRHFFFFFIFFGSYIRSWDFYGNWLREMRPIRGRYNHVSHWYTELITPQMDHLLYTRLHLHLIFFRGIIAVFFCNCILLVTSSPSPSIFFFLSVYLLACLVLVMFLNQSQIDISKHSFDTQAIYFSINAIPIRGRENCWQGKRLRTQQQRQRWQRQRKVKSNMKMKSKSITILNYSHENWHSCCECVSRIEWAKRIWCWVVNWTEISIDCMLSIQGWADFQWIRVHTYNHTCTLYWYRKCVCECMSAHWPCWLNVALLPLCTVFLHFPTHMNAISILSFISSLFSNQSKSTHTSANVSDSNDSISAVY